MTTGYSAEILLEEPWQFDMAELATALGNRFEALGEVSETTDTDGAPALRIDGALVPVQISADRVAIPPTDPGLVPISSWDPTPAIDEHKAHIRVSCDGPGKGVVWAKAYATVVTLVAGALAKLGPANAVHFPASGVVLRPTDALQAGRTGLRGVSPIEAWTAIYLIAPAARETDPQENGPAELHGALTRGLASFIGREVALAPVPLPPDQALARAKGAAWAALDGEKPLVDGETMTDPHSGYATRVRSAAEWLRPGIPVFVLVGQDSPVDPKTLTVPNSAPRRIAELARGLPSKERLTSQLEALPAAIRRDGSRVLATALPLIGSGLKHAGAELKRAPDHARAAAAAARVIYKTAATQSGRLRAEINHRLATRRAQPPAQGQAQPQTSRAAPLGDDR
ncbi:MAG: hypothetical protein ACFBRM_15410 [Pikeienuella sp.]